MAKLRSLEIVKVIRYKSRQWNQTNYYSLDCDRLLEYLNPKKAESTEKSELCLTTDREERNQQIDVCNSKLSYKETNKTVQRKTAETANLTRSHNSNQIAAAPFENDLEEEKNQKEINTSQVELKGLASSIKPKSEPSQIEVGKGNKFGKCSINVTKIVNSQNSQWKSLIDDLDSVGVPINKTLVSLVKMYSEEEVKSAIALIKTRKKEKHIPNLAGYFTAALKGGWSCSKTVVDEEEIDTATVFRHWYDLARELGYCTGQEVRDNEQWVLISGTWERWQDASDRGYSLEYFKKVKARNRGY